jgi:hypothetical protein
MISSRCYAGEVWFLMHYSRDPRKMSLALTCYCDDSGSHDESEFAVVGAVLMNKPRFIEFQPEWEKLLKEFRIDKLHITDFVRPYGKYCSMRSEMKKALFASAAKVINRHKRYSLSIAIPRSDFHSLLSEEVADALIGPYGLAFFSAVILNKDAAIIWKLNNRIAYLVDVGRRDLHRQMTAAHAVEIRLEQSRGEDFTGAMAADSDDRIYALQAADAVAWAYHRELTSPEVFGEEFEPLRSIFVKTEVGYPSSVEWHVHVKLCVAKDGIAIFARMINDYIEKHGAIPTWQDLISADPNLIKNSITSTI